MRSSFDTAPAPALTIAHSAEHGTTIIGATREWSLAIRSLGGWRWSRESLCWYRLRSRGTPTPSVPLERWADRLRAAGAEVAIAGVTPCTIEEAHAVRTRIAGERAESLTARAARARATGEAHIARSRAVVDGIPMGQPILVGHHSERRHRRDIERSHAAMGRGVEALDNARQLEARAAKQSALASATLDPNAGSVRDTIVARMTKELKRDVGADSVRLSSKAADGSRTYWITWSAPAPQSMQVRVTDQGASVLVALFTRASFAGPDCYPSIVKTIRALRVEARDG